jgi:peptidoglycan/LPS O-acetylase OafA/YrhL
MPTNQTSESASLRAMHNNSSEYIKEFDALRALAALAVMVAHFVGHKSYLLERLGWPSVVLFFSLSGYLITNILLHCKELANKQTAWFTLKRFYIRRALRIFPLYYLTVAIFCALIPETSENFWWFFFYCVNIGKTINLDGWSPLNHFWTLAVEEQFYLFWPLFVLLLPIRHLSFACGTMILVAFLSRFYLWYFDYSRTAIQQLTPCCLDALAIGSVIAIYSSFGNREKLDKTCRLVAILSGILSMSLLCLARDALIVLFSPIVHSITFSSILFLISIHSGSRYLSFLRIPFLTYLGRISYGLYVWHMPVMWWIYPEIINRILGFDPHIGLPYYLGGASKALAMTIITLIISSISWYFFERPINALKSKFPYKRTKTKTLES